MFATQRITANASKINFVVSALDEEAVRNIGDLLITASPYTDIRTRLISVYEVPIALLFREIVKPGGLGDRRPSQLFRNMRSSMPPGIGEDALKEFWLLKLPSNFTAILAGLIALLDDMAARADRILEASNPQSDPESSSTTWPALCLHCLCRFSHSQRSSAPQEEAQEQQSRATTRFDVQQPGQLCYYHMKFGSKARAFRPPCGFKPESRENAASAPAEN